MEFVQRIKHQVSLYMPFLEVDVKFGTEINDGYSTLDSNYINVRISYNILPLSIGEILNFKITEGLIEII